MRPGVAVRRGFGPSEEFDPGRFHLCLSRGHVGDAEANYGSGREELMMVVIGAEHFDRVAVREPEHSEAVLLDMRREPEDVFEKRDHRAVLVPTQPRPVIFTTRSYDSTRWEARFRPR